jgi:hypothetical protein
MTKFVVDVVNFNADASCLSSKWWLKTLSGGKNSYLCQWLGVYIASKKKVCLGIMGATIADISTKNKEAINLINENPDIFEIILRPFSHDIALLRNRDSFQYNLEMGIKTLHQEFGDYTPFYLPPEFMLTNEQVHQLYELKVEGIFINPNRFKTEIKSRIPEFPYQIRGIFDSILPCIPFNGELTQGYLEGIHYFNASRWNKSLNSDPEKISFSWRDGESSFFLPQGNQREKVWLTEEDSSIARIFLCEAIQKTDFKNQSKPLLKRHYRHYPVHSFTAWMKEFRMMGFVQRLFYNERSFNHYTDLQKHIWLQVINSDILSAIEKDSPRILILENPDSENKMEHIIWRSERGVEGEELMSILESTLEGGDPPKINAASDQYHLTKLSCRISYLSKL